jgi:Protein of unknown function (DUF2778)
MWTYKQSTGELKRDAGAVVGTGYSGMPPLGKNNPAQENVHLVGPLPRGLYTIGAPHDNPQLGPYAMYLAPDQENTMFGRGGFFMHSDSISHPGKASEGCIVIAEAVRQQVWNSGDHRLQVIA